MRRTAFENILRKFTWEAEWLREEFSRFGASTDHRQGHFAGELVVIRLHDSWARFCRELIVLSAYGRTETLGGIRLSTSLPTIKSRGDVVPVLMSLSGGRLNEPKWYASDQCIRAAQRLNIQNLTTVSAALGAVNSPANYLREVRNFYAHRKKQTAEQAIRSGNFTGRHPRTRVFQLNNYTPGGRTVLESWTDDLIAVATAALQ